MQKDIMSPASPALAIDDIPELETEVGIAGAAHREEVGGAVCFAVVVAANRTHG